jgi:hypothetical protein
MNIIEAVKSGKRFRRPGMMWILADHRNTYLHYDLLATDWEVEEKKVEITFEQLRAAYDKSWVTSLSEPGYKIPSLFRIAKELGLID